MTVSIEFQNAFVLRRDLYERLQRACKGLLQAIADEHHGLFDDRLKSEDSMFSKVESGLHKDPFQEVNDIYAATIAVSTVLEVDKVCERVLADFIEIDRSTARTNRPAEFVYDDLHLVLSLRDTNLLTDKAILGLRFELQIKSMLQFAWTMATHDTVYKGNEISWANDRLAAEVKAALELLDYLFADVGRAAALHPEKENEQYAGRRALLRVIRERCDEASLPPDLKRCVVTLEDFRILARWTVDEVVNAFKSPAHDGLVSSSTLTPVQMFLAMLLLGMGDDDKAAFFESVRDSPRAKAFHVTAELQRLAPIVNEIPSDLRVVL